MICFGKQISLPVWGVVSGCNNKDYAKSLFFCILKKLLTVNRYDDLIQG